jgi:signal transduction histidine kinase
MDTQTKGLYLTIIAAMAFVTLLLLLFIVATVKQLRNRLAAYRRQLVREVELIDRERSRVAADLHDELGSGLSAVGLLLRRANEASPSPILDTSLHQLQTQQQKLRGITYNLSPRVLETHGLPMALTDLCEEIRATGKLQIKETGLASADCLDKPASTHLYRIVREILTNAVHHAHCTVILFAIIREPAKLIIDIRDNGKGFDIDAAEKQQTGMGLQNIRSRIGLLTAALEINSVIDEGSIYHITVPVTAKLNGN